MPSFLLGFNAQVSPDTLKDNAQDLLEEVTINGVKRLAIVNPIDTEKYYTARREAIFKIRTKYGMPVKKENQSNESFIEEYKTWIINNQTKYRQARAAEVKWDAKNSKPIEGWRNDGLIQKVYI